jgi:thiol-disulfide isomerase/thioredoxin
MPFICFGPICIPWTCVWALLVLVLRPVWNRLPHSVQIRLQGYNRVFWLSMSSVVNCIPFVAVFSKWLNSFRSSSTCDEANGKGQDSSLNEIIEHVDSMDSWSKVLDRSSSLKMGVLIQFGATWCGPCKQITPFVQDLVSKQYSKDVIYVKVDVDKAPVVAQQLGPCVGLPFFQLWYNGTKYHEFAGAFKDKLKTMLSDIHNIQQQQQQQQQNEQQQNVNGNTQ